MEKPIKGGYILVSLGLIALSTSYSGNIDYDRISRTKKHIVLTGIKVGDTVMPDITVKPVYGNGTITFEDVYGFDVVVSSNNSVSVSEHTKSTNIQDIVDSIGRKRFIEGDIDLIGTPEGITKSYGKWALSGTHLLIVLAGEIANETVITSGLYAKLTNLPQWIFEKIIPIFETSVDRSNVTLWGSDYSTQTMGINLLKSSDEIRIQFNNVTLTATRKFRKSFDLLIDSAE